MFHLLPLLILDFWLHCSPNCAAQDPYASPTPALVPTDTPTPSSTATPQPTATWSAVPTDTGTPSPSPTPGPLSLARTFWFHDPSSVDAFLAQPTPFPSSAGISIGGYALTKQAQADLAHANGLSVVGGLTGAPGIYAPTGAASIAFLEHNNLDPLIAQKVEGLYVDEPFGQSLNDPRECGPGCFVYGQPLSAAATAYIVAAYNQLFSYIKAQLPNVQVGICESVVDFHMKTLAAGLNADFVCMESYGASTPAMLKQIKFQFSARLPNLKTMMLVYGSFPLCEQLRWGLAGVDYVSLWNIDNYPKWIAGGGAIPAGPNELDPNWAARAARYVNGDTSFCPALLKQPSTDPYAVPIMLRAQRRHK